MEGSMFLRNDGIYLQVDGALRIIKQTPAIRPLQLNPTIESLQSIPRPHILFFQDPL